MVSTTPTNERAVKVLDIQEEPARVLYEVTGPYCEAFEFSSDDRWGIHTHAERGLVSVELSSGRVQTKKGRFDRWWPMIRLDPTNRQIAYPVNIWTKPAIAIQDLAENKIVTTIPTTDFIESIGWHPSGDLLAVGLADLSIGLFDVHERRLLRTIVGHTKHGMMTDFNHRGDWIISNDWSNRLRIWDAVTGRELLSTPSWHHRHRISQDDSIIATESASASGSLRLLRTTRCDAIRTLGDHAGRTVGGTRTPIVMGKGSVAWTELSVSSSTPGVMNSHLAAVSLTTGEVLFQLDQPATWPVAFLEDGSILSAGKTGLHRWTSRFDQQSGKIQLGSPTLIHPEPVEYHVSSSSSGDVIAIARGPSVRVIRKGRDDLVFNQNFRVMWNVGVSPDGQLLAISNCYPTLERKDNIHIIETATGKIIASLPANSRSMIEFSSDGRYFHSRLDSTISRCQIWHVGDWKDPQVIDASAITFAHQGPLAAISNANGTIRLVDFEAGKDIVQFSLQGEESVFVRDFSRDGAYLVVSSDRHNVTRRIDLRAIREQLATLGLDWND
jgi:WD40 repeat protein